MDLRMPEMSGLDAAERIQAEWPADQRPRIIALTADITEASAEACFRLNCLTQLWLRCLAA